ncbi:surface polysaccharide O-acyltransferase-like enzyme [Nocardiopsis sp. Huas11]|uniref:acyltransferase n=1 Tax=Nocardiopsis sp. Huas11 TaxID=2183912 RepID=UPI000EAEC61A|nr:acyltransferase family protein [Nocardiopsis sp. Huas11]RKS06144.1 surface polysaccharide O-acyltransferase-like enzyme [Nocardiopsis sp. Huas11]
MRLDVTTANRQPSAPPVPAPTTNWIGFARVAAMAAVVIVHAFSPLVSTAHADLGGPAWWTAHVVDSALRWCVPVFVMISGGLLLRPREEDAGAFYRRRWAKIGVPLVVWSIAYLVWERWRDGLDPAGAVAQAASGSPSIHLYFLYVIAGLYLLTPFLRTVVAHTPRTGLWWFAGLTLSLGAADQLLGLIDGAGGVTAATRFLPFLGYYLLGWLLMTSTAWKRNLRYGFAAFVLGTAATAAGAGAVATYTGEWGRGAEYVYGYLSPTVVVASVGALLLLRAAGSRLAEGEHGTGLVGRVVGTVSGLSFGVYLVHVMVLNTLRDIGGTPDGVLVLAAASGYAIATAAISLLLVAALRRIPLLRTAV